MHGPEIRQRFLDFFAERDHRVVPSASLIPHGDPSLLLTTAGMVQFKPFFLGQAKPPHRRAASVQKCFRTGDIEEVGHTLRHLTFFEMLGNFSFGDYFKEKAIPYAYQLLTERFRLEPDRLWAGIHVEDDESFEIWTRETDIPPERIRRFGDEYNFWAPGPTGPCGPDSEVHYDWGPEYGCGRPDCGPNCEHCERFLEIWNLVFIQWDRDETGKRTPLERPGIDTGMGLERLSAVVNKHRSIFETDLFFPLIRHWERESGQPYATKAEIDVSLRVLADHSRGATMLLADGVVPSNEGRGYVLRRLIRRAMVHAMRLGAKAGISSAVPEVARMLGATYPEVASQRVRLSESLKGEEERFSHTLRQGMERLTALLARGRLEPEEVFYLHDTMGFPKELTTELAAEHGIAVDRAAVESLMEAQRAKSRAAGMFTAPVSKTATRFMGYDHLDGDATVSEVFPVTGEPQVADVYLDQTPFYAERGGQAADTGWLESGLRRADVIDVQYVGEAVRHRVRAADWGWLSSGRLIHARVDVPRRAAIARHHSATHLLHKALREVLGEQSSQAGSAVLPDYATFDFRFPRALTAQELDQVRRLLNEKIRADLPRRVEEMSLQDAIASGAIALFDEKYGDTVRVVAFGDWARELCGGTHVERTGEIGIALISADRSIGAGTRRIEMRAGSAAEEQIRVYEKALEQLGEALTGSPADLPARVQALQAELKRLEKEVSRLKQKMAAGATAQVEEAQIHGIKLVLQRVDPEEKDLLLDYADTALNRANGRGVAVIVGGRNFAVKVASSLAERLQANDVVKTFIGVAGGKGGGRGPVGEGGGIDPARVSEAFRAVQAWVDDRLGRS